MGVCLGNRSDEIPRTLQSATKGTGWKKRGKDMVLVGKSLSYPSTSSWAERGHMMISHQKKKYMGSFIFLHYFAMNDLPKRCQVSLIAYPYNSSSIHVTDIQIRYLRPLSHVDEPVASGGRVHTRRVHQHVTRPFGHRCWTN